MGMSNKESTEVHVLWWKYYDGSGCGLVRAYKDKDRAEEDLALVESLEDTRVYRLDSVELKI